MRWLDSITASVVLNLSKLEETGQDTGVWLVAVHGLAKSQAWPRDWTTALGHSYDLYSQKLHIVKWTGKRKTLDGRLSSKINTVAWSCSRSESKYKQEGRGLERCQDLPACCCGSLWAEVLPSLLSLLLSQLIGLRTGPPCVPPHSEMLTQYVTDLDQRLRALGAGCWSRRVPQTALSSVCRGSAHAVAQRS